MISSNALTQRWGIIPGADRRKVSGGKEILHKCARIKSSLIGSNFTIIRKRGFHQCQNIHGNRVLFNETEGKGYKTPGVVSVSKKIRDHTMLCEITITAEYLPGVLNKKVDKESSNLKD